MSIRYVWLDLKTGEFSNSWDEEEHQKHSPHYYSSIREGGNWKLIKYSCLTDDTFEFSNLMGIR